MLPTIIVLLLVVVAVAAIVWVVRRGPKHVPRPGEDQETAWNEIKRWKKEQSARQAPSRGPEHGGPWG
jgi:hypothetical protein